MDKIEHYIINGIQYWELNGEIHREDGPAVVDAIGIQVWYQYGELHRTDGPAIICTDGEIGWFIDDRKYSFDEYCKKLKFTPEQILELKLKYG